MPKVVSRKQHRHQRVALQYRKWTSDNPHADRERRIKMLDSIADAEFLREQQCK